MLIQFFLLYVHCLSPLAAMMMGMYIVLEMIMCRMIIVR